MSEGKLSAAQRARVERNRQRALMLRNARLSSRPYPETGGSQGGVSAVVSSTSGRLVDTGGGFLLDSEENEEAMGVPNNFVEDPGTSVTTGDPSGGGLGVSL